MYKRYLVSYSHSRGFGNIVITTDEDFLNNKNTKEPMEEIISSIIEGSEYKYSRDEIIILAISNFGEFDEMPNM